MESFRTYDLAFTSGQYGVLLPLQARSGCSQLKEMMEIKDARMIRLDPKRRPYYSPTERVRIFLLNKKIIGRLRRFTLDE